jgi:hypothetical protein
MSAISKKEREFTKSEIAVRLDEYGRLRRDGRTKPPHMHKIYPDNFRSNKWMK